MKILHSQFAGMDAQSPVASEVVAEKEIGGAWGGGGLSIDRGPSVWVERTSF